MNTTENTPNNVDAEIKVLGAMIRTAEARASAREILQADDFYRPNHVAIFSALDSLDRKSVPVDLLTLADCLENRGDLKRIGGAFYLTELAQSVATSANIDFHSRIVKNLSDKRRVIRSCEKIKAAAMNGSNADELMGQWQEEFKNLVKNGQAGSSVPIVESMTTVIDIIQERSRNLSEGRYACDGVPTGINLIDRKLGGLRSGNLIILAARPGEGKTALALQFAAHVARRGDVLFFSYEMTSEELGERLVSCLGHVNTRNVLDKQIAATILDVGTSISKLKLFVNDKAPSMDKLEIEVKRKALDNRPALIVIDYLQLIPQGKNHRNRYETVTDCSRRLKVLAKETGCPIVALAQLNREYEKRNESKPRLSDLRDSGAIEQDADIVLFIHRWPNEPVEYSGPRELIVSKFRNGSPGSIPLYFHKEQVRFSEIDEPNF